VKDWLTDVLSRSTRELYENEEAMTYLLGRAVKERTLAEMGLGIWPWDVDNDAAPDPDFCERHGVRGKPLGNRVVCPFWSPRGSLLGVECRAWEGRKGITRYLLPEAEWNPVFIGLTPAVMAKIWAGGAIWIVEGLFDLSAMEHIIPKGDVVLATVRAKLTDKHVEFLRRFAKGGVNMVYDNDEAGRHATHGWTDDTGKYRWGALDSLRRVEVECRAIPYRGGKDPGEIWDGSGELGLRTAFRAIL